MEVLINQHIKDLKPRVANTPRKENSIYLDRNELPYPPSPSVIQAITDSTLTLNRYPDTLGGSLRKSLADYAGVREQEIILGNGSDDLIELVVKVFIAAQEEVIIPNPTFPVYDLSTKVMGGHSVIVDRTENFDISIKNIIDKVTGKTKIIFIANPNNPTGNLVSRDNLIALIESVNCLVVIDECYYEMSQATMSDLINDYENLLVLRSLSKSFGLAGSRLGYGIANANMIDHLYRAAQIYPVNSLALVAGMAALSDWEYTDKNIRTVRAQRHWLKEQMETMGFIVYPSVTNFLFVNTKSVGFSSTDLVNMLCDQNIWVRDFGGYLGLDGYYFRMAVGRPDENQKLINALIEVIG